jgi:DNA-binding Lrp family transcriptional regulator
MVLDVVLINLATNETTREAEELSQMPGVSEVYSVAGNYDLVAILRVEDNDSLAGLVADRLRKVRGITRTETLIAFRVYSKHDLESIFGGGRAF